MIYTINKARRQNNYEGDIILSINNIEFDTTKEAILKLANFTKDLEEGNRFQVKALGQGKIIMLRKI